MGEDEDDDPPQATMHTMCPDVQQAPYACGGIHAMEMTRRQLLLTGRMSWSINYQTEFPDIDGSDDDSKQNIADTMLRITRFHIDAYVFGSDRGPDETSSPSTRCALQTT